MKYRAIFTKTQVYDFYADNIIEAGDTAWELLISDENAYKMGAPAEKIIIEPIADLEVII
jgi:hypothetical protein